MPHHPLDASDWCPRRPRPGGRRLLPGLTVPEDHAPISTPIPNRCAGQYAAVPWCGRWDRRVELPQAGGVSVTVSAADSLVDRPADELRDRLLGRCRPRLQIGAAANSAGRASSRSAAPRFAPARSTETAAGGCEPIGRIFASQAIMSIPGCLRRLKALFAPALRRQPGSSGAPGPRRSCRGMTRGLVRQTS